MSNDTISFSSLSTIEQTQFKTWESDVQVIAQQSKQTRIAKKPPKLLVLSNPAKGTGHCASTDGSLFKITRDLLPAPLNLRRYFIAHELGHIEGFHSEISFSGGLFFIFGSGAIWILCKASGTLHISIELSMISILTLCGAATLVAYVKTMLFEWDADRRGARMTSINSMVNGTLLVEQIRGPISKPYYGNKRARLLGQYASIWAPRY